MKTKLPYLILSVLFLGLFAFLIFVSIQNKRTLQNDGTVLGNTAGNLYNGGLFCEFDGTIYFANHNDDNSLYRCSAFDCSGIEKLHSDRVCYINADENYLYYSRRNHQKEKSSGLFSFFSTGLYRLNRDGSGLGRSLYRNPCGLMLLYGNRLYYQHYVEGEGLSLHSVGTDGKENFELSSDALLPACVSNGLLYYSGVNRDHFLHTLHPETGETATLLERSTYFPIIRDEGIYFMTLGNYAILRFHPEDGTTETLVSEPCATYNLSNDGRFLYYQVDRTDNNRICVMDLSTKESTTILKGDYSHIHVTSRYMFFTDFEETSVYAFTTDGSNQLSRFQPTVEE